MILTINRILKIKIIIVTESNAANEHFHDFLYNLTLCFLNIFIYLNVDFLQSNY